MGSMWALCGFVEKEDYKKILGTSMTFDTFVIGCWNGKFLEKCVM